MELMDLCFKLCMFLNFCAKHSKFLLFFDRSTKACLTDPIPVVKLRAESKNKTEFDRELEKLINLHTIQPEIDYPESEIYFHFHKKLSN